MKNLLFILTFLFSGMVASGQFVAVVQMDEDIPGICNLEEVYAIFPMFEGQVEAICPISEDSLLARLNAEVTFLKENPKFKGKSMVGIFINCEGVNVKCEMSIETRNAELDKQIELVFKSLAIWTPATLDGKEVDSHQLFSFKIKKGQIVFD